MARPRRYPRQLNLSVNDALYDSMTRVAELRTKRTGLGVPPAHLWREAVARGLRAMEAEEHALRANEPHGRS